MGKSKHFGWVEFASKDVAEIVAIMMDGYLIHPHRMVCKVMEVDDKVWKKANKVFKMIPWKRINSDSLEVKRTKEDRESLTTKEEERNRSRKEHIKELGMEYEFPIVRGEKREAAVPSVMLNLTPRNGHGRLCKEDNHVLHLRFPQQ